MTTPDQPTPEAVLALAATTFGDALMRQLDPGKALLLAVDAVWSVAAETAEKTARGERERGVAEGRRQATEGWERQWAVDLGGSWPMHPCDSEADARRLAAYRDGRTVVSRLVGPWEADEQAEAIVHKPGCACGYNDAGHRFIDLICRRP